MRDRILWAMAGALLVLAGLEGLLVSGHGGDKAPWKEIAGGMGLLGLASCLILALGGKLLGKHLLQRPEKHHDAR